MQRVTPDGLRPAVGTSSERFHIVCIQNAAEQAELHKQMLVHAWASKTPQQAFEFLSKPDVDVTNKSDKDMQLPKLLDLSLRGAHQHRIGYHSSGMESGMEARMEDDWYDPLEA